MERLRKVAAQLLPTPVAGTGNPEGQPSVETSPRKAGRQKRLSQDELTELTQNVLQYSADGRKLVQEGALPPWTAWDFQVMTKHDWGVPSRATARDLILQAESDGRLHALKQLPGPWQDADTIEAKVELTRDVQRVWGMGGDVFQFASWQLQYGDSGLGSNIAVPSISTIGYGDGVQLRFSPRVVLAHPEDAERVSRLHVRKEGNFEPALFDSIISTTDNDKWREQRQCLNEAFLPLSSLAEILPVSLARAKQCTSRLREAASKGSPVDMSDFLLHEAQAQLQLALLGAPEELMDATNSDIRATFAGDLEQAKVGTISRTIKEIIGLAKSDKSLALPTDGHPVKGPLSRAIHVAQELGMETPTAFGNLLLILFAGHDTTGHTMTWLLFEAARRPEVQQRLQQEADSFFASLGGRDPAYADLGSGHLTYLDRCITETLRLWPAVASGTFRQLQFDEEVHGTGGAMVTLPRGTPVNIVNWSRHRNPELWGADADEFNPDRSFLAQEMAHVGCPMAARNPQSQRFSPFAHQPRSCLGRNFAQMEMRLIMLNLLRDFDFRLAPPYDALVGSKLGSTPAKHEFRGVNRATMGPMDLERTSEHRWGVRPLYALKMHVQLRQQ